MTVVATVDALSSSDALTVVVADTHTLVPLVGHLVACDVPVAGATGQVTERALGTITEVTTRNRALEQGAGAWAGMDDASRAALGGGDWRQAQVRLQAVFRRDAMTWRPAGGGLTTSPGTCTPVSRVDNEMINALVGDIDDIHYLGHLAAPAAAGTMIRLPMRVGDFTGPHGAFHTAIVGATGSGKSAVACYHLAGQMRHETHGTIVIDPQGQFSHEHGLPFSLQGWAVEMGRQVTVRRIVEDLRLEKDAPLLCEILAQTRFAALMGKMGADTRELLFDEMARALRTKPDWPDADAAELLPALLHALADDTVLARIYADPSRQDRLREQLADAAAGGPGYEEMWHIFAAVHNLFAATNPAGGRRHSLWGQLAAVFERDPNKPAPLLIIDMSAADVSWLAGINTPEEQAAARDALAVLDTDRVKATILRRTVANLRQAAEHSFRGGQTLNTAVVFDEAARFAPAPGNTTVDPQVRQLSQTLAEAARDTRKFGLGWTVITQSPRGVHPDIWDQTRVKLVGYGLTGADLEKVAENLDDRGHLRLYRAFAPPEATNPHLYPFMVLGPVSPLTATKAPVMLAVHTDFDTFRADNHAWISRIRAGHDAPILAGPPSRPREPATQSPTRRQRPAPAIRRQHAQLQAHAGNGGSDPAWHDHLAADPGFGTAGLTPQRGDLDEHGHPYPF